MSSFAPVGASESHSAHLPYHARLRHLASLVGGVVSVGASDWGDVVVGRLGGSVMVDRCDVLVPLIIVDVLSLPPQNRPGVKQVVLETVDVLVGATDVGEVTEVVVVLSLQPNQPLGETALARV